MLVLSDNFDCTLDSPRAICEWTLSPSLDPPRIVYWRTLARTLAHESAGTPPPHTSPDTRALYQTPCRISRKPFSRDSPSWDSPRAVCGCSLSPAPSDTPARTSAQARAYRTPPHTPHKSSSSQHPPFTHTAEHDRADTEATALPGTHLLAARRLPAAFSVTNAPGQPPWASITSSISAMMRMVSRRATTIFW